MATSIAHTLPVRPNPRPTVRPSARPVPPTAASAVRSARMAGPGAARPVGTTRTSRPVAAADFARRRRAALLCVALVVGSLVAVAFLGGRATADENPTAVQPPAVYVVQPGDSLWSIAERFAPDADPRPVVAALKRAAGGADVRVGQRIILPPSLAG